VKAANVVDHIKPHRGDRHLFWDENNLQALCWNHHQSTKQKMELGYKAVKGYDKDGWPIEGDPIK
jgi:5-methylcytosine-specific restriction endonuclease McrA